MHVKSDLDAYVCLFDECDCPNELYAHTSQWLKHMRTHALRWKCKSHPEFMGNTRQDFIEHMQTQHESKFSETQLGVLADRSARADGLLSKPCVLCGAEEVKNSMEDHVVGHLRLLALKSLPTYEDVGEEDAQDLDTESSAAQYRGTIQDGVGDNSSVIDSPYLDGVHASWDDADKDNNSEDEWGHIKPGLRKEGQEGRHSKMSPNFGSITEIKENVEFRSGTWSSVDVNQVEGTQSAREMTQSVRRIDTELGYSPDKDEQSEKMIRETSESWKEKLGPDHQDTLTSASNLPKVLQDQGKYKEAEEMYLRALQEYEKAWSPDQISIFDTVNNLGLLYSDQGKMQEAEKMYLRALRGYEKAWGPDHMSTLDTVNNLGNLYSDQGKMQKAEEMYLRAIQRKEKAWGPDHTSTFDTVNNLGLLYKN
jgi:tetratricopeptide (TPR) repeat protein